MSNDYFQNLNYSLANEDTKIELDLMNSNLSHVFVIPSSGSQALPLLAKNPKKMDIVDLSFDQLALTNLRIESMRRLDLDEWISFMGYSEDLSDYRSVAVDRSKIFKDLDLLPKVKEYFAGSEKIWRTEGFIWLGKWERFFKNLSLKSQKWTGYSFEPFFEFEDLESQKKYYNDHWPKRRFRWFLNVVTAKEFMNALLYKGSFIGTKLDKKEKSTAEHIDTSYRWVFQNHLARRNYFMQMLFLGKIKYKEALPIECNTEVFYAAKKAVTEINYFEGPFEDYLFNTPYDFVHFSDVISYLPEDTAANLLSKYHPEAKSGTLFVARSFMKGPKKFEFEGWVRRTDLEALAINSDCTGVYDFFIAEKN